jgi:hypothetical protein
MQFKVPAFVHYKNASEYVFVFYPFESFSVLLCIIVKCSVYVFNTIFLYGEEIFYLMPFLQARDLLCAMSHFWSHIAKSVIEVSDADVINTHLLNQYKQAVSHHNSLIYTWSLRILLSLSFKAKRYIVLKCEKSVVKRSFDYKYLFFFLRQCIVALTFTCGAISMPSTEAAIHYFMDFI